MADSEACPSDDGHDDRNETDEDASPSQCKKSRCDDEDDDDGEQANDSESSSDDCVDKERMNSIHRNAVLKIDCKKMLSQFHKMAQDLRIIMHVQMKHKATKCKRGTEMPAPEPKRRAPFNIPTWAPRKVPISLQASQ